MSMDVTFRESKPFYGENTNLCSLFYDLDSPSMGGDVERERMMVMVRGGE